MNRDLDNEATERSQAARILGGYVLIASVVLGIFGLVTVALARMSFADFDGWYYVFLGAVVVAYLLYQRLTD